MVRSGSISVTIAFGIVTVALTIGLLVGWILVIVQYLLPAESVAGSSWLLALGSFSFVVIITVVVLFSVFLVRETRTVQSQTRFIDSVTHELKSPLASLKLCLGTLGREDLDEDQRAGLRQMMLEDVERLSIFIDDIIQAGRLSHRWEGHSLERVSLIEVARGCAEGIARYYKQPPAAIALHIAEDLTFTTDRAALEIILKNLIDNAVKYSVGLDRPVEVTVEAEVVDRELRLVVRDRGVGIDRRYQKHIFERFYRAPREAVRSRHGTGLGLFVVSALVRVLRGTIEVTSEGEDRGTTMRIRLPVRGDGLPPERGARFVGRAAP